ncbi:sodium:proton exchanger [Thermoplasmatales archaeon SG8-52-4]|nr:MAG: sodium:proton exchanger [Thermoplasmatales archaeon SG8-52-4]
MFPIILALFFIGFIFLIKGADFLVDGASTIAKKLRVSDLIIGLTVVAFGTSAPELIVNIFASIQGNTQIAIGNVLGSNIINIFVILGVSSIIFPLIVKKDTIWKEIPFCLFAAVLLGVLANDNLVLGNTTEISQFDGLILIIFFIIFIYYILKIAKKQRNDDEESLKLEIKQYSYLKSLILIIVGLFGLNIGAKWVVDGAVEIAKLAGVSQSLIALTIVAFGTSLPELVTSIMAVFKKNSDIAIGNIVGSNIFNILLIIGVSSLINPLQFSIAGNIDIFVAILAPFLLFLTMFTGRKKHTLERWEGVIFLVIYSLYLVFVIIRG